MAKASGIKTAPLGFHKMPEERKSEAAERKRLSPMFGKHSPKCVCGVHPECRRTA